MCTMSPGVVRGGPQAIDHRGVAAFRHEADVLAVGLVGHGEAQSRRPPGAPGAFPARPGGSAENPADRAWWRTGNSSGRARDRRRGGARRPAGARDAAHIVAGGQRRGAEVARHLHQIAELHRLVAAHAGDRRLAPRVGVGEILDHRGAEAAFVVQHIVGDGDGLGGGAGVQDILAGAAGALLLHRRAVVVELQGDAHHVVAGALEQGGGDGGIHAARHGRHHPRPDRKGRGVARGPLDVGVDVHGEGARGEHGRSLR